METGEGRRQLREYQLRLAHFSDPVLLEDFLNSNKLIVDDIITILK